MKRSAIVLFLLAFLSQPTVGQTICYVDVNASNPTPDGSSWCSAYLVVQACLNAAASPDSTITEIRVADGTYTPTGPGGPRTTTFQLVDGVALRGGYAGCGALDPDEQDIELYESILTGDIDGNDGPDFENNYENSYHVVTGSGTDETAVLDGFTITGGNADDPWQMAYAAGGGMYNDAANPTITNCMFRTNWAEHFGGGMYNYHSSPTLINCTLTGNSGGDYGGGMFNELGDPVLTNCTFSENSAYDGGGMRNSSSSPTLMNCTFSGNSAGYGGGGMNNFYSSPTVMN